jgi:hypothetical protein
MNYKTYFASAYGSCAYGNGQFDNATQTCASGTAGGAGASGGGVLTNTGFDILLVATLACAIALTAVVVRFVRRPAKKAAPEA